MSKPSAAWRVAMSMREDQAAWLEQLLSTVARGGDARVLMRSKTAADVRRIVQSASQRAARGGYVKPALKRDIVLAAARSLGREASKKELQLATGFTAIEIDSACKTLGLMGLLKAMGARGPGATWRVVERAA